VAFILVLTVAYHREALLIVRVDANRVDAKINGIRQGYVGASPGGEKEERE